MAKKKQMVDGALAEIVAFARAQLVLEDRIRKGIALLEQLTAEHRVISQESLPAAMAEAGLKEFQLDTGEEIKIKEDFAVGIAVADRVEAFGWLEKKGYGGLIKTQVIVAYGKGEIALAQKLVSELLKKKLTPELKRDIHWQTLRAFVVESAKAHRAIPTDLFGVTQINKSIITLPK